MPTRTILPQGYQQSIMVPGSRNEPVQEECDFLIKSQVYSWVSMCMSAQNDATSRTASNLSRQMKGWYQVP